MKPTRFRRPAVPVLVSIALHMVLGAGLVRVLLVPGSLHWELAHDEPPKVERIGYIALPQSSPPTRGRDGGDDRPKSRARARPAAPFVAPSMVPTAIPAVPRGAAPPPAQGGSGPRVGAGGAAEGIRPSFSDPRVWAPPGEVVTLAPTATPAEQLDHTLRADIARHNDSLALYTHVPSKLERGDWTTNGPGGKWGVEPGKIRLGKFSLPSAVLALLPLNLVGKENMAGGRDVVQERAMLAIRHDIEFQSQRMLNEEELRVAAKRIRERVDRERREKAQKTKAQEPTQAGDLQP